MDFAPNRMLGHYRLVEKIGEGGMGVVWRATDTTLDRDVAIKVVPEAFSEDPDRLSRFEREAKLLASLNHPGIATIHGLHHVEGVHFLVMELVPGLDLAQRLAQGPIAIDDALGVGLKVAEALEAAHENGVIHRDLKPANIQITPDGKVKILDFGLAKALLPDATGTSAASMSPTLTTPAATRAGVILGTAAYMSPEQAKGKPVDRRADIWAFGCLLFEMLAGHRPFQGDGVSEVIAAVIMSPVELRDLPPTVPPRIRALVRRCLEKDPRRRLRDMGEARFLIEETLSGVADEGTAGAGAAGVAAGAPARGLTRGMVLPLAGALALGGAAAAGILFFMQPRPPEPQVRRFELPAVGPFRSGEQGRLLAISPNGQSIAYVDTGKLFVRPLSRLDPTPIPTRSEPVVIFWSPDSAYIGYATSGKLWRAPASGGESTPIVDIPGSMTGGCGVSWGSDGRIVLTRGDGDLMSVSAQGGDFETILKIEHGKETDFHDPEVLPDASGVLAVSHSQGGRPDTLILLAGGKRKDLVKIPGQDIWFPVYSPTGHILYRRHPINSGIWALPFSLKTHAATGEPFLVAPDGDLPSVAADGTLVHAKGISSRATQLAWVDRTGKVLETIGPRQEQWPFPELSPDGRHVAIAGKENEVNDIWIDDIERGTRTRMSAGLTSYSNIAWSPDGDHIYYNEGAGPPFTINIKNADGGGEPRKVASGWAPALTADGRRILYTTVGDETFNDLAYSDLQGDGKEISLVKTKEFESFARPSPDGQYFAYVSDESGNPEVYIKRFPTGEGKWQVSTSGGFWPHWNRRGNRLYYAQGETIMEVDVTTQPALTLGKPRPVFTRRPFGWPLVFGWPPSFDVSAQEDRFVIAIPAEEKPDLNGIVVQENWAREFTRPGS